MANKTIAIITDKPGIFFKTGYFVACLVPYWQERQLKVVIGSKWSLPKADVAILHVDVTEIPFFFKLLSKVYPIVLNGCFTNNSKRKISKNILSREDNYNGPVIIKTNNNYGGLQEINKRRNKNRILHDLTQLPSIDWSKIKGILPGKYPVIDSKENVPEKVWKNRYLVVEKFIPELNSDGLFCLRACLFFGNVELNILVSSREPVIKGNNLCSWEITSAPAPDQLRDLKKDLCMDFGRLDYVMHEEEVILYDANKTASLSRQASVDLAEQVVRPLASGIDSFL